MAFDTFARRAAVGRGIALEHLTVGWNILEGIVAIVSGALSGSIVLMGFGIDSGIESASGGILLWRLYSERRGRDIEAVERRALKLVGVSFILLSAYVAFDAAKALVSHDRPERSVVGILLSVLSLIVMPLLARAKRRTAAQLNSRALHADSRQTSICAYLSAILLGGLLLNALLGWWWADPIAALVMVPIILNEGREALRGETCDACP
jgi:divalent metal cation (Fe/Co/Zn/Cd) transporter